MAKDFKWEGDPLSFGGDYATMESLSKLFSGPCHSVWKDWSVDINYSPQHCLFWGGVAGVRRSIVLLHNPSAFLYLRSWTSGQTPLIFW